MKQNSKYTSLGDIAEVLPSELLENDYIHIHDINKKISKRLSIKKFIEYLKKDK